MPPDLPENVSPAWGFGTFPRADAKALCFNNGGSGMERRSASQHDWLASWHSGRISSAEALGRFDGLPIVEKNVLIGRWRGSSLPTGHPLDGLLEALGWYGKQIANSEQVHPLLFRRRSGRVVPLDPALMPTGIALRWPDLARSRTVRAAFARSVHLLQTRRFTAKIRTCEFNRKHSAALIYNNQPIVDHFRLVTSDQVIGMMRRTGMEQPFFFLMVREDDAPLA